MFFIPGVDLGLVYGRLQMAVMAAKLPQPMHRGVVDVAANSAEVLPRALELAQSLRPKGQGPARKALGGIKRGLYKDVLEALAEGGDLMDLSGTTKGVDRPASATSAPVFQASPTVARASKL